eukprot:50521-Pelagomonas_calceolata.AAC.2
MARYRYWVAPPLEPLPVRGVLFYVPRSIHLKVIGVTKEDSKTKQLQAPFCFSSAARVGRSKLMRFIVLFPECMDIFVVAGTVQQAKQPDTWHKGVWSLVTTAGVVFANTNTSPAAKPMAMLNKLRHPELSSNRMMPAVATMTLFMPPVKLYSVAVDVDMYHKLV